MTLHKIPEIARILGISESLTYRKFKQCSELLQNHVQNDHGVVLVDEEGIEIIRKTLRGNKPTEQSSELLQNLRETIEHQRKVIDDLLEERKSERQRHDTIVMKLIGENGQLLKKLEDHSRVNVVQKCSEHDPEFRFKQFMAGFLTPINKNPVTARERYENLTSLNG